MKCVALVVTCAVLAGHVAVHAATLNESPVVKLVGLITELKSNVESDGQMEQQSYDKYACWCEKTLERKAVDMNTGKVRITELDTSIMKLKSDLASTGAEIAQLKKDSAANLDSQKDATDMRTKENADYEVEKTENEQCIGALEAAVSALTGAGSKKGFLQTIQETQVLSVVAGVREVLARPSVSQSMADKDFEVVKRFVEHPQDFVGSHSGELSAAQIAKNPFGDYAPQSTQIQGILKGMYDGFTSALENANVEESDQQKSFEELMATKASELSTLQSTLQTSNLSEAEKTKQLSEDETEREDTRAQLKADETFFADTKDACKLKAGEWATRTRLRTEELMGMSEAITILSGGAAVFDRAHTTLVQLASVTKHEGKNHRAEAFKRLKALATTYRSIGMAEIAAEVRTGGHFDKVITMIDAMIAVLRKEEQSDIAHRDRCEGSQAKNANNKADLASDIAKAEGKLTRMGNEMNGLGLEVDRLEDAINSTNIDMTQLLELRNQEVLEYKASLKDDADSIVLIEQATAALTRFYKQNKIPLSLSQKKREPEYTVDADKAPETTFSGGDYGGRKSESGGVIAILNMIKEDLEKDMKTAASDDAAAEASYEKNNNALKETRASQEATKVETKKAMSELDMRMNDLTEHRSEKNGDLEGENSMETTLGGDCAWVATHFDSRRQKRKHEIDGLVEAKNFLAGAESGEDMLD